MSGTVVLLNGASSSGKSTLATALLPALPGTWFHLSVDTFHAMRSRKGFPSDDVLRRTRAGFHRAVAGMAAAGNDVVVDHVLSEPWRLPDLLSVLAAPPVLVGVHCSLPELVRREAARGDRPAGLATSQAALVHLGVAYDLEVDTSLMTVQECVAGVLAAVTRGSLEA